MPRGVPSGGPASQDAGRGHQVAGRAATLARAADTPGQWTGWVCPSSSLSSDRKARKTDTRSGQMTVISMENGNTSGRGHACSSVRNRSYG